MSLKIFTSPNPQTKVAPTNQLPPQLSSPFTFTKPSGIHLTNESSDKAAASPKTAMDNRSSSTYDTASDKSAIDSTPNINVASTVASINESQQSRQSWEVESEGRPDSRDRNGVWDDSSAASQKNGNGGAVGGGYLSALENMERALRIDTDDVVEVVGLDRAKTTNAERDDSNGFAEFGDEEDKPVLVDIGLDFNVSAKSNSTDASVTTTSASNTREDSVGGLAGLSSESFKKENYKESRIHMFEDVDLHDVIADDIFQRKVRKAEELFGTVVTFAPTTRVSFLPLWFVTRC
jgi:hypothetical protein